MELSKIVDSFAEDLMNTDSSVDLELLKYRDHGWVCDIKNFHTMFEEMLKASTLLHQNGEDEIQILEEELAKLSREVESTNLAANNMEEEIKEIQNQCDRLKNDIKEQDKLKANLGKMANSDYMDIKQEVSVMEKKQKLLYLITRINWDEKALKRDIVKGYVVNKTTNDVSVFETNPKKTNNKAIVSDLLWDYIGAGVSPEWKKK